MSSISEKLSKYDAHSSVPNEFRVRTGFGATLSISTIIAIIYLIYTEAKFNFQTSIKSKVNVNATSATGIQVDFNISFPKIPCALLSIDANDPSGQMQSLHLDRDHRIWKYRLDGDGNVKGTRIHDNMGNTLIKEDHLEKIVDRKMKEAKVEAECGSCYGAGDEGECCDTCEDVKRAYESKSWYLADIYKVSQCRDTPSAKEEQGEGCQVVGHVALSSGGGNLHFAPGRGLEHFGHESEMNMMDYILEAFENFNVTHTINKLRFGDEYPGAIYQLDNQTRTVEDGHGMYQYYMKVVPTTYTYLHGKENIESNQFSVTEHLRHVNPGSGRGLPGVFFMYEVSPLHVKIEETEGGWIRFLTSVCLVVGGVFRFMSFLDKVIYDRVTSRNDDLGSFVSSGPSNNFKM